MDINKKTMPDFKSMSDNELQAYIDKHFFIKPKDGVDRINGKYIDSAFNEKSRRGKAGVWSLD